jgi:two-component system sensor histidine kinase CpxA
MPVAIAVGGATTFVLVLLFTRPLVKLRKAARALAEGKLSTRVGENSPHSQPFKGDEFNGLIHDFNNMADRLESLVDAQKLLLRDVSHELRSPLARLSVALELAREDADPDLSMDAHLNRIEREAEKLNQLIGQLLTLSSMEAIQNVDNFHPVSLTNVIEQLLPDAAYEAQQRNCSVDFTATAECVVNGNHDLLYRALENVVRNAIRYSKPGSKVEIQLAAILEEGRELAVLEVNDSGPGIPEVAIRSIFRPFYRVDHARSPETGGFGVGLAITDRAVKLHHGQIQAFNKPGGGTKVRMTLPLIANESKPGMISAW